MAGGSSGRRGLGKKEEESGEREKRVWQELLNWSFDWTHRDGFNVILGWDW